MHTLHSSVIFRLSPTPVPVLKIGSLWRVSTTVSVIATQFHLVADKGKTTPADAVLLEVLFAFRRRNPSSNTISLKAISPQVPPISTIKINWRYTKKPARVNGGLLSKIFYKKMGRIFKNFCVIFKNTIFFLIFDCQLFLTVNIKRGACGGVLYFTPFLFIFVYLYIFFCF